MKKQSDSSSNYYQEADHWRYQIHESQTVWLHRSLLLNLLLLLLLTLMTAACLCLFPLKQSVPYVYALNQTTGELTQLGKAEPRTYAQDWLLTRYFLIQYVINRESYSADNLERPYQITYAMSDATIAKRYEEEVNSNNPRSPLNLYSKDKIVTVHVLSVSQLNHDTAEVRFIKTLHDKDANTQHRLQKTAIIKWKYTTPITTQKMLDRNPLGFKVTYYQVNQVNID
jgi:type IV secretion system protein VirB8